MSLSLDRQTSPDERAFPIVIVGHVDHGKSTLVGRLLHDTDSIPDSRVEELRTASGRRGVAFEWSFLLDALQVERDQGITLDVTQTWFRSQRRRYVVIDAPGHKEFLKNMVSGAASADAAVLVIDAQQGVCEQTRRHAYLLRLLGIGQMVVAVNKMDLVGFSAARYEQVAAEIRAYLADLDLSAAAVVPLSARSGDNLAVAGETMPWWSGPTLLRALDAFESPPPLVERPLRLPVQDVYRLGERRVLVGRIESGRLRVGDQLRFAPGGATARVRTLESWNAPMAQVVAAAGQSVALTLDDDVFVERGHLATAPEAAPLESNLVSVRLFWLGDEPLRPGQRLKLKLATAESEVTVEAIERVIDVQDLGRRDGDRVERNGVAEVLLRSRVRLAFDRFADSPRTGRAVLVQDHRQVGGCIVEAAPEAGKARNLTAVATSVTAAERGQANGHAGGVLWMTGLSGAGKSTLAMGLQRHLFDLGAQVVVLDGDNLRHGLGRDLGFAAAERREHIRRTAEVARLFSDAGLIVIGALISPARADRELARDIIGRAFREVHVDADLGTCQARDPKGLYARAKAGEIADFTGVTAAYEVPVAPELAVATAGQGVEACVARLVRFVAAEFGLPGVSRRRAG